MNARSKKVLITLFSASITVMLPAGCGFEAVPGIIGGGAVGPIAGAGSAGGASAGSAGGAGAAAGTNGGMGRGGVPAGSVAGAGGILPTLP